MSDRIVAAPGHDVGELGLITRIRLAGANRLGGRDHGRKGMFHLSAAPIASMRLRQSSAFRWSSTCTCACWIICKPCMRSTSV
ncbi:hypothetical protein EV128_124115 [Rhizobium azibense]|nr:hypothetical protein EV128_124115 [Rhizobium azibense]